MSEKNNLSVKHKLTFSEFSELKMIKQNEIARAVSTKLLRDSSNANVQGYDGKRTLPDGMINRLSKSIATNIEDSTYIFQTLPDTKIAMEIWVSCLTSPKDGMSEALSWSIDHSATEYSAELFGYLLDILKDYFEKEYDLKAILKPAIENALFKTGSYPLIVIPESGIDDIVNGKSAVSNEAVINSVFVKDGDEYKLPGIGLLGDPFSKTKNVAKRSIGLEGLITNPTVNSGHLHSSIHPGLYVSDNPDGLKLHRALSVVKKQQSRKVIRGRYALEGVAQVDLSKPNDVTPGDPHRSNQNRDREDQRDKQQRFDTKIKDSLVQTLYKDRAFDGQEIVTLKSAKDTSRQPLGHPLVMHIPSASIIPVHIPGKPEEVVGAFIIVDEYGNVLNNCSSNDLYDTSRQSSKERIKGAQNILKQMNFYSNGCTDNINASDDHGTLNELAKTYGALVEEDLLARLSNGIYGDAVEISRPEEIYRIMLSRALSTMKTQLIYCPAELLTYFAFDYNKFGIGKSLLEDGRTLATLRASMMYADIFAKIENSTGRRKLTITLDEDDPNPGKTIEHIRSEYNRVNSWNLPLMSEGPIDAINTLREANIDLVVEGDNRAIPTTRVDVEDVTVSRGSPDQDLQDNVKNMHNSSFGIPATVMDETQSTEFAITAKTSHTLFNKRIINNQEILSTRLLEDHVTKYTLNSGTLIKRLALKIKEYKELLTDEQRNLGNALPIIEEFLMCLSIKLPSPDSMRIDERKEDIDKHKSFIEDAVEMLYPDSVMQMILPESITEQYSTIKDLLKSILIGQYMSENNYLPELDKLLDLDNVDDTISAAIKTLLKPLSNLSVESILTFDRIRKENEDSALKGAIPEDADGGSSYGGSDDSSSDDTGGSDEFGMDDGFDMGDDMGGDASDEAGGDTGDDAGSEDLL